MTIEFGVLGGSGLTEMQGLALAEERSVSTPFGDPSAPIQIGELAGRQVAFLARHGAGHSLNPTEVNYRANIFALKSLGVTRVISISACGSLREDFAPGEFVVPDQLYDNTKYRRSTFFEGGLVAHVSVADPFCPQLSRHLADSLERVAGQVHRGGSYLTVEGPRFSTRAESNTFRAWGMSLIGMTTSPEAFLAREAEMCYTVVAHVTDYDVWRTAEESVTAEIVIRLLKRNTDVAKQAVAHLITNLPAERNCHCGQALASALTTPSDQMDPEARQRLSLFVDPYLG